MKRGIQKRRTYAEIIILHLPLSTGKRRREEFKSLQETSIPFGLFCMKRSLNHAQNTLSLIEISL